MSDPCICPTLKSTIPVRTLEVGHTRAAKETCLKFLEGKYYSRERLDLMKPCSRNQRKKMDMLLLICTFLKSSIHRMDD
ncbi:hypothetical protein SCA6_005747 [Theobroma cacao]